ncbi:MAG: sigma factor-like helix-turn-helix DNA-binding protein, partial [Polyangia bacterium]
VRAALDLLRAGGVRAAAEVEPDDLAGEGGSPELDYVKDRYRPQFKAAFQEALRGLDAEQRNVLRLHVVEGLNIDEIGALFKVHRSTVARWIAGARQQVLADARARLRAELGLSAGEFDSLAGVVRSQLDLSVAKILVKSDS